MMKIVLAAIFGLAIGCGAARADCRLGAVAVLPLEAAENRFVVPVDIGNHDAHLMIDTGAFATELNVPAAERLGVRLSQTSADAEGIGGVSRIYRGTAAHMRLGGLKADGMMVAGGRLWEDGRIADGLLGMNMMAAYDLDFDVVGKHFIIYAAEGDCRKPTVALSPALYDVALEPISHEQQAVVMVEIEGRRLKAMIDSGAAHSFMYRGTAEGLGVDLAPLRAPGHGVSHGIGQFGVAVMPHVFKTVSIGSLQVNNMRIDVLDQKATMTARVHVGSLLADQEYDEAGGEQLLLGADFFQRFHVWISHSSHRVIMQYPPVASVLPR